MYVRHHRINPVLTRASPVELELVVPEHLLKTRLSVKTVKDIRGLMIQFPSFDQSVDWGFQVSGHCGCCVPSSRSYPANLLILPLVSPFPFPFAAF